MEASALQGSGGDHPFGEPALPSVGPTDGALPAADPPPAPPPAGVDTGAPDATPSDSVSKNPLRAHGYFSPPVKELAHSVLTPFIAFRRDIYRRSALRNFPRSPAAALLLINK